MLYQILILLKWATEGDLFTSVMIICFMAEVLIDVYYKKQTNLIKHLFKEELAVNFFICTWHMWIMVP